MALQPEIRTDSLAGQLSDSLPTTETALRESIFRLRDSLATEGGGGGREADGAGANGVITDVRFFGDFLSVCGLEELVERLKGVAFRPEDVRAVLNDSPVGELFGGITADEVTATIFDL